MDEKKLANKLVKKYMTRNPFEIIQGMNVILVFSNLVGVRGFTNIFRGITLFI